MIASSTSREVVPRTFGVTASVESNSCPPSWIERKPGLSLPVAARLVPRNNHHKINPFSFSLPALCAVAAGRGYLSSSGPSLPALCCLK